MRILVTGGAGYVGSILTMELLVAGHSVIVLDNLMWGQSPLNHLAGHARFDFVRGDARDTRVLGSLLIHADVIIPLAALVGAPLCDQRPNDAKSTNFRAVVDICTMSSRHQRIIFPNTNSGYGAAGAECDEDTPLQPISLYGRTKKLAEDAVLCRDNSVAFRLATVFGISPRMRLDLLVNDFTWRAVTDGALVLFEPRFRRNFIHVRDVARAFAHAIDRFDAMRGRVFNVGLSEANLSKLELCQRIARHVPRFVWVEAPIGTDPDKRDYVVSNARIEAAGFAPAHSLDDGIAELIKGFRMLHLAYRNA